MTKPTIILISGGLNDSSPWNPLITALKTQDYPTLTIPLPSIAPPTPLEDFTPDVLAIRNAVQNTIDDGKDVVVVMQFVHPSPNSTFTSREEKQV